MTQLMDACVAVKETRADLFVGFNLASSLVAEHFFHEVELLHQVAHFRVLDELGVWGLAPHLVLVDGLDCRRQQRVEQQLQAGYCLLRGNTQAVGVGLTDGWYNLMQVNACLVAS